MALPRNPPALSPASVTDCPKCGVLCLGAITLPCGHLICRKCCRLLLQQSGGSHLTCYWCKQHLPLPEGCVCVSQVVKQLGTDPVVHDLVQQRLRNQKHPCHIHKETTATTVCEDCQECYCDVCSHIHRNLGMSTDHVLRPLPAAGHDLPSASSFPPRLKAHSTSSIPAALSVSNLSMTSGESAAASIAESRGESDVRQWVQKVVTLLQQASLDKHTIVSSLKKMASVIDEVLSTEAAQEELLQTYSDRLFRCDLAEQIDDNTFVISGGRDDIMITLNIEHLEQRLCNVIDICQSTSVTSAERISTMLHSHSDLFHTYEPRVNTTVSASARSPGNTTAAAATTNVAATTTSTTVAATVSTTVVTTNPTAIDTATASTTAVTTTTTTTTASPFTTITSKAAAAATTTATTSSPSQQTPSHPSAEEYSASSAPLHTHAPLAMDMMTATPHKAFVATPASADDARKPVISSIVYTQDEKLVLTDWGNKKVKVVDMSDPHSVSASLTVEDAPCRLAVLSDGLVAMTTWKPTIYLLQVSPTLAVTSLIQTCRQYAGVAEGLTDHTLLVSCGKTDSNPGCIDIITRDGVVVRTVVDSTLLTLLRKPDYLCVGGGCVLVSDWGHHAVYSVDVTTGRLTDTLRHTHMKSPREVSVDGEGNIYIASDAGQCVLGRSTRGQWRRVVYSPDHTDQGCDRPRGVCVTRSGRLVVAWYSTNHSVVTGYDLK